MKPMNDCSLKTKIIAISSLVNFTIGAIAVYSVDRKLMLANLFANDIGGNISDTANKFLEITSKIKCVDSGTQQAAEVIGFIKNSIDELTGMIDQSNKIINQFKIVK